jgi:hypothetical protein
MNEDTVAAMMKQRKKYFMLKSAVSQSLLCNTKLEALGDRVIMEFRRFFETSDIYLEIELIQLSMKFIRKSGGKKYLRYFLSIDHSGTDIDTSKEICAHIRSLLEASRVDYESVSPKNEKTIEIEFYSRYSDGNDV